MELRRALDIDVKEPVDIFVDGEQIVIKKYSPNMACVLTGEVTNKNKAFADGKLILNPKG